MPESTHPLLSGTTSAPCAAAIRPNVAARLPGFSAIRTMAAPTGYVRPAIVNELADWRTRRPAASASLTVDAAPELHGSRYATVAGGSGDACGRRPATTGVALTVSACGLVRMSTSNNVARFHAVTS